MAKLIINAENLLSTYSGYIKNTNPLNLDKTALGNLMEGPNLCYYGTQRTNSTATIRNYFTVIPFINTTINLTTHYIYSISLTLNFQSYGFNADKEFKVDIQNANFLNWSSNPTNYFSFENAYNNISTSTIYALTNLEFRELYFPNQGQTGYIILGNPSGKNVSSGHNYGVNAAKFSVQSITITYFSYPTITRNNVDATNSNLVLTESLEQYAYHIETNLESSSSDYIRTSTSIDMRWAEDFDNALQIYEPSSTLINGYEYIVTYIQSNTDNTYDIQLNNLGEAGLSQKRTYVNGQSTIEDWTLYSNWPMTWFSKSDINAIIRGIYIHIRLSIINASYDATIVHFYCPLTAIMPGGTLIDGGTPYKVFINNEQPVFNAGLNQLPITIELPIEPTSTYSTYTNIRLYYVQNTEEYDLNFTSNNNILTYTLPNPGTYEMHVSLTDSRNNIVDFYDDVIVSTYNQTTFSFTSGYPQWYVDSTTTQRFIEINGTLTKGSFPISGVSLYLESSDLTDVIEIYPGYRIYGKLIGTYYAIVNNNNIEYYWSGNNHSETSSIFNIRTLDLNNGNISFSSSHSQTIIAMYYEGTGVVDTTSYELQMNSFNFVQQLRATIDRTDFLFELRRDGLALGIGGNANSILNGTSYTYERLLSVHWKTHFENDVAFYNSYITIDNSSFFTCNTLANFSGGLRDQNNYDVNALPYILGTLTNNVYAAPAIDTGIRTKHYNGNLITEYNVYRQTFCGSQAASATATLNLGTLALNGATAFTVLSLKGMCYNGNQNWLEINHYSSSANYSRAYINSAGSVIVDCDNTAGSGNKYYIVTVEYIVGTNLLTS